MSCHHPSLKEAHDDPMAELMAIFASVHRVPPMAVGSKELNIVGDQTGIRGGWFNFPWNFDPRWLKNCDGYKKHYKWFKLDDNFRYVGLSESAKRECELEIERMNNSEKQ